MNTFKRRPNPIFEHLAEHRYPLALMEISTGHHDLHQVNNEGHTLLLCAIANRPSGNPPEPFNTIVFELIRQGVNPDVQDYKYSTTALMYSLEVNIPEVTKKLIEVSNLFLKDSDGLAALALAIKHEKKYAVDLMCQKPFSYEEIQELRKTIKYPQHGLSPYAQNLLDRRAFELELDKKLPLKDNNTKVKI